MITRRTFAKYLSGVVAGFLANPFGFAKEQKAQAFIDDNSIPIGNVTVDKFYLLGKTENGYETYKSVDFASLHVGDEVEHYYRSPYNTLSERFKVVSPVVKVECNKCRPECPFCPAEVQQCEVSGFCYRDDETPTWQELSINTFATY